MPQNPLFAPAKEEADAIVEKRGNRSSFSPSGTEAQA